MIRSIPSILIKPWGVNKSPPRISKYLTCFNSNFTMENFYKSCGEICILYVIIWSRRIAQNMNEEVWNILYSGQKFSNFLFIYILGNATNPWFHFEIYWPLNNEILQINPPFIIKSGFKSRVGYNGVYSSCLQK